MLARIHRFLFICCALFAPLLSMAQGNMEDVVYLKNGSIIHGVIIEQVPNVSIKIQTADRNVFVFRIEEVEKITKEATVTKPRQVRGDDEAQRLGDTDIKKSGYSMIAEICPAVGIDEVSEKSSIGLQVINGYQINPHFNVGIGLGLHKHISANSYAPVFLDLRFAFMAKRVSPYLDLAGGWALGLVEEFESGVYFNPAFGVKFFVSRNTALQLSLGYRYQETNERVTLYDNNYQLYVVEQGTNLNAVTLKFGVNL
ncbi:MAG: hypothetical protein WAU70_13050 [Flavobacteriales bacterium]